jgi:hypothetical protein
VLIGFRLAAWLLLLVQVWRVARSRTPVTSPGLADHEAADHEPVDREPVDQEPGQRSADPDQDEVDPLAGPMAGAPDHVLVRLS